MRPVIYALDSKDRTRLVANAMREGMLKHGVTAMVLNRFDGLVYGDIAIAYGWSHERVFRSYPNYAYFDLGYWDRRPKMNKKDGYHRLAVNSWDTADNMMLCMPADRLCEHRIELKPWGSKGRGVLITAMSDKAAITHGFRPRQWEAETMAAVTRLTDRPLTMRPKPTSERPEREPIEAALARSHMLITHHSNTAVDAVIAGVPFWCRKGVGRRLSVPELAGEWIENPPARSDAERLQFLQDVSYAQWRPSEMSAGKVWEVIRWILRSL